MGTVPLLPALRYDGPTCARAPLRRAPANTPILSVDGCHPNRGEAYLSVTVIYITFSHGWCCWLLAHWWWECKVAQISLIENKMEVQKKIKNRTTIWFSNSLLGIFKKEMELSFF